MARARGVIFLFLLFQSFTLQVVKSQAVETVVQTGHYAGVTAVCYSTDGKIIVTGSNDKTIKLWRASDGREIHAFTGSKAGIRLLEMNKQGTFILSLTSNGTLAVWNIATGKIEKQITIEDDVFTCASFHPNGLQIVAGSQKSHIGVWDIASGVKIIEFKATPTDLTAFNRQDWAESKTVSFSTDGQYIIAGLCDQTAVLWEAKTGKELHRYKKSATTCTSCVSEAIISPDNKYVISAYSDSIKVFDRVTGVLVKQLFGENDNFSSLVASNDSRYIAAIEYGVAEVWDLATGKRIQKVGDASDKRILSVAFSPNAKQLITGNEMRTSDIWDIATGKKIFTLKGYLNQIDERLLNNSSMHWASLVNEAKLSPEGRYIAVGRTGNNAKLVDFKTGKIRTLTGHSSMVVSVNFSNDGKYLATGGLDGKAILWDVESGKPAKIFKYRDSTLAVFSVDISSDNRLLATADWAGYIVIWDIETGKSIKTLYPHGGNASYHVKFSPNGLYVISAGLDRKLKLIEIDTGEEIREFKGHTNLVNSINLNPTGDKIITSASDGTIRVWDFLSGLQILKIKAHEGGVYSARFDASGKYIVSGGDDYLVKLWDANTGSFISEFKGHQGGVGDVNISLDQKYIVSGSRDGSIRIWSIAEKREILSMIFMNGADWFIKSPEGYFDASEGAFNSISFVKGTEMYLIGQFFTEFYRPGLYRELLEPNQSTGFRQNVNHSIDSYPPPTLEMISPENGTNAGSAIATCMVKITNNGGGVKELKVMHNGKRQAIDEADLKRMNQEGQYTMKTFDINLIPGKNEIEVSAFSEGDIESEPTSTIIMYKGLQKTSNCYIVSIGINKYENENLNLTFARPDAQSFAEAINLLGKNLFNKIYTFTFFDKDATKENILSKMDDLSKTMQKEDVFVFFYAGHGSTVDNFFYFITSENTGLYQQDKLKSAIHVKELQEKLKQLPALKQVVFIDACQSGSSVDLLAMRGADEEKALAQLSRSSGIHVLASSESQQQAAEIKSLGHGVFTYVLLEALKGKADGSPKDSKITVYELKSYLDDQVPEISYQLIRHKQFPSTFSIGHDFPLVTDEGKK